MQPACLEGFSRIASRLCTSLQNCKKTMAMIQVVLGERRRAAEAYGAEVERQATAAAAAAAGGPPAPAPAVRLVPPTPEDARALDARAAAAAAVKLKYSGAKVSSRGGAPAAFPRAAPPQHMTPPPPPLPLFLR